MKTILQDIRYAFRQISKYRSFTAVAVLTLAVGIGANTAIFSVVDSILLQPLPFLHSEELTQIQADSPFPKGWVREYQKRAQSFVSVSGYTLNAESNLSGFGSSDRAFGSAVSVNLFETLETHPVVGRFFAPSEENFGEDSAIVLSYGYWKQRFAEDPTVVGRKILVDGVSREIIGVAPSGISFPNADTQFWVPISFKSGDPNDAWADSGSFNKRAIGRLKHGVSPSAAQAELRTLHPQMLTSFPWRMPDRWAADVTVVPLLQAVVGNTRPRLFLLLGIVGLVLLIACANVANMMLARAAARQREMSIRRALGANTPRLIRQLLTESLVLSVISGLLGLALAASTLRILKLVLPPNTPRLWSIALHGDVLIFAVVVSLLTGILTGIVPAWNAGREDLQTILRANTGSVVSGSGRFRISRLLAIGQIALAVVVITAAGVMLRSLFRLSKVDPGFRTDRTITAQISLDRNACENKGRCTAFFQSLLDHAQGIPAIQQIALTDSLPLTGTAEDYVFDAEGHPREARETAQVASGTTVSTGYFELMGIRLLRGCLFTNADEAASFRSLIISESLAKRLWPNQDPIGKYTIQVGLEPSPGVMDIRSAARVVGVVTDTRHESLARQSSGEVYIPMSANAERPVMRVVVRSNSGTKEIVSAIRELVARLDPSVPVTRVAALNEVVMSSAATEQSLTRLLLGLAILAVTVGTIGVYSLISYTVSWRTREIGLRMALGADRSSIAAWVLRESLLLAALGSIFGLLGALSAVRVIRQFLFETSPADPLTYTLVALSMSVFALIAAWAPARRAAQVDPIHALRME